jgi:DNA primase
MSLYPPGVIEQVKDRSDIMAIVSERVSLKKAGASWKGLCPFHSEKTPSFQVDPAKQVFYCFGCNEGGDVLKFIMKTEGLSFGEALRDLAGRVGVSLPEPSGDARESRLAERMMAANAEASLWFKSQLAGKEGAAGREYVAKRKVDPPAAQRFALGYAPGGREGLLRHLTAKGFSAEVLEQAGLVMRDASGFRDRFRDRLIFPITGSSGKIVGFGGRALGDADPKYLNSPETPIYHKGRLLYALALARPAMVKKERALIMEGYFDVITAHRFGFEEAVAPLGTALTGEQADLLRRLAPTVFLVFDSDAAGRRAAARTLETLLPREMVARVVLLPSGDDPDTFLLSQGAEAFEELLGKAVDLVDYALDGVLETADVATLPGRKKAVDALARWLSLMPGSLQREFYLGRFLARTGLDPGAVKGELARLAAPRETAARPAAVTARGSSPTAPVDPLEREAVRLALADWTRFGATLQAIDLKLFRDETVRKIVARLRRPPEELATAERTISHLIALRDDGVDALVASTALEPEEGDCEVKWEKVMSRLHDRWFRSELQEISRRITQAEGAGEREAVMALMIEKKQLMTEHR